MNEGHAPDPLPISLAPRLGFADLGRQGRAGLWRYLVGLIGVVAAFAVLNGLAVMGLVALGEAGRLLALVQGESMATFSTRALAVTFAFLLASVALLLPPAFLLLPWLHKRPWRSFFTARERFDWRLAFESGGLLLALSGGLIAIQIALSPEPSPLRFDPKPWFVFLALTIVLVPLQVAAEELFFRGYVLQTVGRLTRLYAVRLVVPALLFAAAHLSNPEALTGGAWAIASYLVIAFYLGFLALRAEGLEAALGVHVANNAFVALVANSAVSALPSPALFIDENPNYRDGFIWIALLYGLHALLLERPLRRSLARWKAPHG